MLLLRRPTEQLLIAGLCSSRLLTGRRERRLTAFTSNRGRLRQVGLALLRPPWFRSSGEHYLIFF